MAKILLVEDDPTLSAQVKALLESQEHTVEACDSGSYADVLLLSREYDIVLLDWDLPGLSGVQICRNYRTRGGQAPVLMLTGKQEDEHKEQGFDAGADDYLTKPFSMRELLARVKAMLRRRQQTAAVPATVTEPAREGHLIGTVFAGKYKILDYVGGGGAGSVYRAHHTALNRPVAIKFLHSHLIARTEARTRFQREAQALSKIEHPHILRVFDFGLEQGQPYIVMELLNGVPLSFLAQDEGGLPLAEALPLFLQICEAMEHAHKHRVIHRDLKPANVLLVQAASGAAAVKVIDFGLSKLEDANLEKLTQSGVSMGTPEYMSPEQCRGEKADERSDIYSMGCLMFEVLSGLPVFDGASHIEVMIKQASAAPAPPLPLGGTIARVVARALEKRRENRYQSFAELKTDLEGVL